MFKKGKSPILDFKSIEKDHDIKRNMKTNTKITF